MGSLGPGATFTNTLTLTVRPETVPGTYRMKACADSSKAVSEQDDNDNCKTSLGTVEVTPQPDLFVRKVTVPGDPLTVDQGESLTIRVIVRNVGLLDAPASTLTLRLVSTVVTPPRAKSLRERWPCPRSRRAGRVNLMPRPSSMTRPFPAPTSCRPAPTTDLTAKMGNGAGELREK